MSKYRQRQKKSGKTPVASSRLMIFINSKLLFLLESLCYLFLKP